MTSRRGARRAALAWSLICAGLLLALAVAPSATAAPRSFHGVMPQTALTDADLDRMGQARVGTLRFQIPWRIDPSAAVGDTNYTGIDAIMAKLATSGIKPLPFIYSTPAWAAQIDGQNCSGNGCAAYAPRTAAGRDAFKAFLVEVLQRYGRNGEFWQANPSLPKTPIRSLQILNEQNSPSFYKPRPKVKAYAKLLSATRSAIDSVDPSVDVVLGGMFGTPLGGRKPGIAAWKYLDALYRIKGAKQDFDGVAPHPYAARMKKVRSQLDLFIESMRKGRDRNADLWITELGWASSGPSNPLVRGDAGQASRLKQAYRYFAKKRRALNIRSVVWYSWRDNPDPAAGLCEWCAGSGLVGADLAPKPALRAFTGFTGGS
jgi:hypothetical protein